MRHALRIARCCLLLGLCAAPALRAAESIEAQLQQLVEQNRRLQAQLDQQQRQINELRGIPAGEPVRERTSGPGSIRLGGEVGLGFFDMGSIGQNPNAEFRVDEARLYVEAPVWRNAFFLGELELVTREANDEFFHVGELYVDLENVSGLWGRDGLLNLRLGRFYIPFGEEYQHRTVMKAPLISHSVADIWGIDEGIGIYGFAGRFDYVLAVQNGGNETLRDFDPDKSVAGRIGFNPAPWLRLSGSAMRTGALSTADDFLSAQWFAGGFFRSLSPAAAAPTFEARLYELDAMAEWRTGRLKLAGGRVLFSDDAGPADSRRMRYYSVEVTQDLAQRLYGAIRFSRVHAPRGYPLAGQGSMGRFFFAPNATDDLQRFAVGLGYRFGEPLVLKVEYNRETGRATNGRSREEQDVFASELGVKF